MSWRVVLHGDDEVLQELAAALADPAVAIVHDRARREFLLASRQLDVIDDGGAAKDAATHLIALLRGVARLHLSDLDVEVTLGVDSVERFVRADAPISRPEQVIARSHAFAGAAAIRAQPLDGAPGAWLRLAAGDKGVARVLTLIGDGVYWNDVAEIIAIIAGAVGGEQRIVELRWASQRELDRLRPQAEGIALPRAIEVLILRIVRQWLDSQVR